MTPLPEVLPESLAEIQVLITERLGAIQGLRNSIGELKAQRYVVEKEINSLQAKAKVILGIKQFPKKKVVAAS